MEVQKEVQCNQFRDLLKEKEEEIALIVQEQEEKGSRDNNEKESPSSYSEEVHVKIQELEAKLREERSAHENEVVALQVGPVF